MVFKRLFLPRILEEKIKTPPLRKRGARGGFCLSFRGFSGKRKSFFK